MTIIDSDGHYTPKFEVNNPWFVEYSKRKVDMFSDAEIRVAEIEQLGLTKQLQNPMGPSLGLLYDIPKDDVAFIMQTYNTFMQDLCKEHECFEYNAWVGFQDLPGSMQEIDRLQDTMFGVHVAETPAWGFIDEMKPVWKQLADLKIPWYSHLTRNNDSLSYPENLSPEMLDLKQELGFWKFSLASLILGNVIDENPDLRIAVAERGIDWVEDFRQSFTKRGFVDPLPYIQNNFWFTTEPEAESFIDDANLVGWDRLLFATDWPHDFDIGGANSLHDVQTVNDLLITKSQRDQLFYQNHQKLSLRT